MFRERRIDQEPLFRRGGRGHLEAGGLTFHGSPCIYRIPMARYSTRKPETPRHIGRPRADQMIPLDKLIVLREKGLSYVQIGKILGCTAANVKIRLNALGMTLESDVVEKFKEKRADILASHQFQVLENLGPEKLKKAGVRELSVMFGILYDKERLERGQSTANISTYAHILREEGESADKLSAIEAEIASRKALNP